MAAGYKSTIEHTIQLTNEWVHQIDELMPWDDSNKSFRLLRAVLHTVRDMLGVEEAAQLSAQLPLFIRGVYFEGWNPSVTPSPLREKPDFVARIVESFAPDMLDDPEDLAIVESVLGLAAIFDRQPVAEGVETLEHGALLLRLGCALAQGFGIARPMPPEQVCGWIASHVARIARPPAIGGTAR